jgi:hypothetical protein
VASAKRPRPLAAALSAYALDLDRAGIALGHRSQALLEFNSNNAGPPPKLNTEQQKALRPSEYNFAFSSQAPDSNLLDDFQSFLFVGKFHGNRFLDSAFVERSHEVE